MHSGMGTRGQRAFHPAGDYCHLCLLQGSALPHRQGHACTPCPAPEPGLGPLPWRRGLPLPFPLELGMAEDQMGNHDRHVPQRRQVYLGLNHCPVSESCSPPWYSWREVSESTWDWPLGPRQSPCTCAWERPRECECMRPWYPTEQLHPFNGGHVPQLLPAKARGHGYYREARYVATEHYWDYYKGTHLQGPEWDNLHECGYNGHCERRHVTFQNQNDQNECDSSETSRQASPTWTHCNGPLGFFPTEVPQSRFRSRRMPGSRLPPSAAQGEDPKLGRPGRVEVTEGVENQRNQRKSHGTVREQIKQVVMELEDVLGGLKQVQLEMKEVVHEIDILTSNIDLGEEETQDPGSQGNCFGVVALIHNFKEDVESLQQAGAQPDGGLRTNTSLSECTRAAVTCSRKSLGPTGRTATVVTTNGKGPNHVPATDAKCIKSTANGDCLPSRLPRARVKELWQLRTEADQAAPPKTLQPLFPVTSLAKTHRPLPHLQNGHAKATFHQSAPPPPPPDILKMSRYPGKKKPFPSTVV